LQLWIYVIGYHHGMHLRVRNRRRIRIAPIVNLHYSAILQALGQTISEEAASGFLRHKSLLIC
jgi:hypothetical protein